MPKTVSFSFRLYSKNQLYKRNNWLALEPEMGYSIYRRSTRSLQNSFFILSFSWKSPLTCACVWEAIFLHWCAFAVTASPAAAYFVIHYIVHFLSWNQSFFVVSTNRRAKYTQNRNYRPRTVIWYVLTTNALWNMHK